jgi:hypothetical protein
MSVLISLPVFLSAAHSGKTTFQIVFISSALAAFTLLGSLVGRFYKSHHDLDLLRRLRIAERNVESAKREGCEYRALSVGTVCINTRALQAETELAELRAQLEEQPDGAREG